MQASENSGTVDLRHFTFYAFAGRSGLLRWSRKNEVIHIFMFLLLCFKIYKQSSPFNYFLYHYAVVEY